MIHIPNDKRAEKSAEKIFSALKTACQYKAFADITVSDLQKISGISRSTFYRLFDNCYDVLYYQCDKLFSSVVEETNAGTGQSRNWCRRFIRNICRQSDLIVLLKESGHIQILRDLHKAYSAEIGKMLLDQDIGDVEPEYLLRILSDCIPGVVEVWIERGMQETPEQLEKIMTKAYRAVALITGNQSKTHIS